MSKDEDTINEAKEIFDLATEAESDNRKAALDDIKFARLGEQWPEAIRKQRELEGRPCLTINRMLAFIRQVVNDSRQNKPSIKVHPVDSGADPETAEIFDGLIRSIEYQSSADVAYDTAVESAVTGGFGYFRIGVDYAHDDSFNMDIRIERVSNPFSVYGDPRSRAADSSDWDNAFIVERMSKDEFRREYKGADQVDWEGEGYEKLGSPWREGESIQIAEWWQREEVEREVVKLSDGSIIAADDLAKNVELQALLSIGGVTVTGSRKARSYKVTQRIMTGCEVLETNPWKGRYIPIVPVYGDEVDVEGKRYFRSLIRDARDAQQMLNFWRTASTELVALAPKTPFIGRKGAFKTDARKWSTANTASHPYIEFDGDTPPVRQPFAGPPAGAIQEALNAQDDMKSILGIYDASLGAKSNETSGRAILARQREGDIATFHFIDNMSRAIRCGGRILVDLIPHYYSGERIVRTLGEDGTPKERQLGVPVQVMDKETKQVTEKVYDLSAGKYDLTVKSGPSFTTRREEAAVQMMELIKSFPDAAPVIGDLLAKNLDWPGADEIAERLKAMVPGGQQGIPPELAQQMQEGMAKIGELTAENQSLKMDKSVDMLKLQVEMYKAITDRLQVNADFKLGLVDSLTTADEQAKSHELARESNAISAEAARSKQQQQQERVNGR